jgi:hypothetical protein
MLFLSVIKRVIWYLGISCLAIFIINSRICHGYVLPSEQLVEFMTNNFLKIKTVDVIVSASKLDMTNGTSGKISSKRIVIKSPDLFHIITLDQEESMDVPPDEIHLQLLVSNEKERIELLLSWMGINLKSVAFTRIDDIIAYRIGDKYPDSPKILIEKKRFLPLQVVYLKSDLPLQEVVIVRFNDYRKLERGWFPHEITCSIGDRIITKYIVQVIRINTEIDDYLLQPSYINISQ